MEFKEIKELIKLINESNLTAVSIKQGDFVLKISKEKEVITPTVVATPPQVVTAPVISPSNQLPSMENSQQTDAKPAKPTSQEEESKNLITFRSPMIGTFYRAPKADAEPFVKVGDIVTKGKVLCLIEAMKIFNEIESDVDGKIVKVLVDNATPVEYDQPLFLIEPTN
ncbi:MAG: acetyl-CoA carboxylase biotin carboxyl carrier protein [Bacteroidia bacterium]|nr:acetyl-CoA carboxylase biotin carboxyl carrier protein [Bacteroidia bacterium]MDW8302989.1 acetyl-CoA carboxylase biotin carboxyl carrier protein [Bacteroidia bacterium]